jgi:hypothetical protein
MRQFLNTLYVTRPRAYLHLDHDTVRVEVERQLALQAPLMELGAIVCFGDVLVSPALLHRCAEDGRSVSCSMPPVSSKPVWKDRPAATCSCAGPSTWH